MPLGRERPSKDGTLAGDLAGTVHPAGGGPFLPQRQLDEDEFRLLGLRLPLPLPQPRVFVMPCVFHG